MTSPGRPHSRRPAARIWVAVPAIAFTGVALVRIITPLLHRPWSTTTLLLGYTLALGALASLLRHLHRQATAQDS